MRLRKRKLEMILSRLSHHPNPSPDLEQYELSPESAAEIIVWAWEKGDVEQREVCDLGCGTGILTIGAALSGARRVCGVDLDPVALRVARENINIAAKASGIKIRSRIELREADVAGLDVRTIGKFDTAIQNPPFGVHRRSSDRVFIRKALEIAPIVYSLHKGNVGVKRFVHAYVGELGGSVDDRINIEVPIPHQFAFHKRPSYLVAAEMFRIRRKDIGAE